MRQYIRYFRFLFIIVLVLGLSYAGRLLTIKIISGNGRGNTERDTTQRVFDYGEKLTEEEEARLNELIAKREKQTGSDIILVVLNESLKDYAREKDPSAAYEEFVRIYAEDFYVSHKFGYDKAGGDGILLLDNWYREENGKVYSWLLTSGRVKARIKEERLEDIFDAVYRYVEQNPYQAYTAYVNAYYKNSSAGSRAAVPGWIAPIAAAVAALCFVLIHLGRKKGSRTTVSATYVNGGKPVIHKKEDLFLNKVVTTRRIQRNDDDRGSGGSSSGSGGGSSSGSFGGGGRSR